MTILVNNKAVALTEVSVPLKTKKPSCHILTSLYCEFLDTGLLTVNRVDLTFNSTV